MGRRDLRLALVPFAAALLVAAVVRLGFPFDGLYGQDAYAYFDFARRLGPALREGAPLPPFYWPVGYPAVVALLLPFSGGPGAGQIASVVSCAWGAAATFLLVRELAPARGVGPALVAGLVVALSGAALRYGQMVMADGVAMGAAATALWLAARHARTGRGGWLVAAAVVLAWGTITRWMVGLLALPIGVFLLLERRRLRGDPGSATAVAAPRHLALAAAAALALLVPQLLASRTLPASFAEHQWLRGWSPANAFTREFHTPDGHQAYRLPVALFYLARLGWPDAFFPALALLAAVGAWTLIRDRRWSEVVLLVGWPAAAWLFLSGIPYENPRFLVPVLPALGALSGLGFSTLRERISRCGRRALALALCASIAAGLALGAREHARLVARKNRDLALVSWVAERVPAGATLLSFGPTLGLRHYGGRLVLDLFEQTPRGLDALVVDERPLFVLVDVPNVEHQWAGLSPHRNLEALRGGPGLSRAGGHPPYTLFRVGR